MYKHILIATDGSECSAKGVEAGIDIAKAYGARATILHVSEPYPAYDLATRFGLFLDDAAVASYEKTCRDFAGKVLADAAEAAKAAGIACDTIHVADTAPAKGILDTATSRGCDLIVVTSHGRSGLERLMLGSQAGRVIQGARISVLVVR